MILIIKLNFAIIRNPVRIARHCVELGLNTLDTACCTVELVEICGLCCYYALMLITALSAPLQLCIAIYCA